MEPDLDRLFDFESYGGLFPQFGGIWDAVYAKAHQIADTIRTEQPGRCRVAINTVHPLSFSSLFLAFAREGLDLFLFNPTWGRVELETAIRIADVHYQIGDLGPGEFEYKKSASAKVLPEPKMGVNKLRVMIPTGGSSGRIRFAVHDWSTLSAATYGFQQHMACAKMAGHCVLPLYHVSGFMQLIRALLTMGSVVFGKVETFAEGHSLLLFESPEDRFLSLVSTQLERLLSDESNIERLKEYRAVFIGGGPAAVGLIENARQLKIPLALTYGMTETGAQVATLKPEQFLKGITNQGCALPHISIDIMNEEATSERMPAGETGLIQISGMSLFGGYYGDDTPPGKRSIQTSDLGKLDQRGYLTVLGRADRVIISGGEKINLREIELVFEESGFVRDVHAFGLEDNEWGQALAVAYVPQDTGIGEAALQEFVNRELAPYKRPKKWIRMMEIPRNEAGKPRIDELLSSANVQSRKIV